MGAKLSPRAVLIDLAGVLHTGDDALPGAVRALDRLRASGLPLRFLTNTTRTPSNVLFAKLQRMGFTLATGELQTAALAARTLVRSRGLKPLWLVHPDIAGEMGASAPDPDVVVLGDMGPHFTYPLLNHAFRLLMAGVPLLAMARNRYFMEPDGLSLDMGAFVNGLEYSAGVSAEITGKPAPAFFNAALAELGLAAADTVLIRVAEIEGHYWLDMRGAGAIARRVRGRGMTIEGYAPLKLWRWLVLRERYGNLNSVETVDVEILVPRP